MRTHHVDVAGLGFRFSRQIRRVVGILIVDHHRRHGVDFLEREAGEREVVALEFEIGQLLGEQLQIPARVQGDLVVGQDKSAPLGLRQARQDDDRHVGHLERQSSLKASVASNDAVLLVD